MKTLLLMRHAKSDWEADYGSDHERPLNERGERSARIMGRVLSEKSLVPDLIVTSTAVRARSTATLAKEAGEWSCEIVLEPALYGTGADAVVERASQAPDVDGLMLVGHQPTWSAVVSVLSGDRVDMKTATVAVISVDLESWRDLTKVQGDLVAVYHPRDYELDLT